MLGLALLLAGTASAGESGRPVLTVPTGLLNVDILIVNDADPVDGVGGGMAVTDQGVMIARQLDGRVEFYATAADRMTTLAFLLSSTHADLIPPPTLDGPKVDPTYVRYQDIETIARADGLHLLVSHDSYDQDQNCFATRLDDALLPADWYLPLADGEEPRPLQWRTLLQGTPCLPATTERNAFGGNQAGGAIVVMPDGTIYTTTGDLEFDGLGSKTPAVSHLEGSTYGRVLRIDPSGDVHELARGFRNPQGLTVDADGRLWATDHGPMGGDELNLIVEGADYGWPKVTLGVNYGDPESDAKFWPNNPIQGHHDGFEPPVYAWMPSVAPSAIKLVSGFHPRWDGDLLVATLAGQAFHRLRLAGGRVLYDEPVRMERRIRAIEVDDGRIYVLFDDGRFGIMTPHEMIGR